jgi:hypothetical protein
VSGVNAAVSQKTASQIGKETSIERVITVKNRSHNPKTTDTK